MSEDLIAEAEEISTREERMEALWVRLTEAAMAADPPSSMQVSVCPFSSLSLPSRIVSRLFFISFLV